MCCEKGCVCVFLTIRLPRAGSSVPLLDSVPPQHGPDSTEKRLKKITCSFEEAQNKIEDPISPRCHLLPAQSD